MKEHMKVGSFVKMSWGLKVRLSREPGNDEHIRDFGSRIGRIEEINHGYATVMWFPSREQHTYEVDDLIEI